VTYDTRGHRISLRCAGIHQPADRAFDASGKVAHVGRGVEVIGNTDTNSSA
jgi:hypothetical protein